MLIEIECDEPEAATFVSYPLYEIEMAMVLTISTALWAIIALLILVFYPLNRKRAYEIRDQLEARRGKV